MIRVAVADASAIERRALQKILNSDPELLVVGSAGDGNAAFELVWRTRPEVLTLGLHGDLRESHEAVRLIMAHCPTAILMMVEPGQERGESLAKMFAAGAMDAMERPQTRGRRDQERSRRELVVRVRLLARVPVVTHVAGKFRPAGVPSVDPPEVVDYRAAVAIVCSTGGPVALVRLLGALPQGLDAPVFVVQHIPDGFAHGLALWFQENCRLKVRVATAGDVAKPGTILVAPDAGHMAVTKGGTIEVDPTTAVAGARPSGDRLFQSVAAVYGPRAIGVVLTGMGSDGAQGACAIKEAGGRVIVQDEATSAIFGMPRATIEAGAADEVLPLERIAERLVEWVGR